MLHMRDNGTTKAGVEIEKEEEMLLQVRTRLMSNGMVFSVDGRSLAEMVSKFPRDGQKCWPNYPGVFSSYAATPGTVSRLGERFDM